MLTGPDSSAPGAITPKARRAGCPRAANLPQTSHGYGGGRLCTFLAPVPEAGAPEESFRDQGREGLTGAPRPHRTGAEEAGQLPGLPLSGRLQWAARGALRRFTRQGKGVPARPGWREAAVSHRQGQALNKAWGLFLLSRAQSSQEETEAWLGPEVTHWTARRLSLQRRVDTPRRSQVILSTKWRLGEKRTTIPSAHPHSRLRKGRGHPRTLICIHKNQRTSLAASAWVRARQGSHWSLSISLAPPTPVLPSPSRIGPRASRDATPRLRAPIGRRAFYRPFKPPESHLPSPCPGSSADR